MQLKIFWVGKTKNPPIRSLIDTYVERIRHFNLCEIVEVSDVAKRRAVRGEEVLSAEGAEMSRFFSKGFKKIVLAEQGRQFTSIEFARFLEREQNHATRGLEFIIGGPNGLSSAILEQAYLKMSLSSMTWTHEMCRVLLLEQLYRALSILRNIPYHK
jgi:23S rRNA (pseudouridine1915-N3)-methyltransferase